MGLGGVKFAGVAAALLVAVSFAAPGYAEAPLVCGVDVDDDDADGVADREAREVPSAPELAPLEVAREASARRVGSMTGSATLRVLADGKTIHQDGVIPPEARRVEVQARSAGSATLVVGARSFGVSAILVGALDSSGEAVDFARSHVSLERRPPDREGSDGSSDVVDSDALRFFLAGDEGALPSVVSLRSVSEAGRGIDGLPSVALYPVPCPASAMGAASCRMTPPIRAVVDDVDRRHPLVAARSLMVELGGAVRVELPGGRKLAQIRVAGPRKSPVGAIERLRARLRVHVLRVGPHGPAALGSDDASAVAVARAEVRRASGIWAACGIGFGPEQDVTVRVVDPPASHLLAVGCDLGLPASGGTLRFLVEGKEVVVPVEPGAVPSVVARAVASRVRALKFDARVMDNVPSAAGAFGTSDVSIRLRNGSLARVEPAKKGPVSDDPTLRVCIGTVDLSDGLDHFTDVDAVVGTMEERTLVKAYDDDDPTTVDIFFIPFFARGGRIGESFIGADRGALRNVVIEDRAGLRAERSSFALAHELGHVFLDDPGHPDDFAVDTPHRLMDGDAANGSAYGPRRLSVEECARAIRQAGPSSGRSLLTPWPLAAVGRP